MTKIFKCKDIPYYIIRCPDKITAAMVAVKNRWEELLQGI